MSLNVSVPGVSQSVIDTGGTASRPYYVFFQSVATSLKTLSDQIDDVTTTPTDSPISENANVVGKYSIYTRGILKTGIVSVLLIGDVETPGNTQYYGSDATGEKGWHAVSDALDSTANITLTVGTDGVTTFDLADLANSGTGAALVKLTRDAKGRISGTSAATTDDLTEGSANLWFTNERAQDAVGAALVGTGNVPLSYNDTGNAISAALSAGVLASLSLADTSVQPGDNVSGLTNDAGYLTDAPSDGSLYGRKNGAWSVFSGAGSGDVVGPASAVDGDAVLFDGTTGKLIKDGGSFGSLVRATVLTGLSTATSAVITATDTVLGALGKLQAQITDNLLPKGYIDGLRLVWVSSTALTVTSGAAYIESTGKVLRASSDIAKTGLSLSASTTYHVYFYDNAGTPAVEVVTTAPATAFSGTARSKTSDTTRRYLGSFITDSSSNLLPFVHTGDDFLYPAVKTSAPFRVLANGTATSPTTVDMSASVPTTATAAHLRVFNQNNVNISLIATGFGTVSAALYSMRVQTGLIYGAPLPLGSAKSFDYALDTTGTGGLYVDVTGYRVAR